MSRKTDTRDACLPRLGDGGGAVEVEERDGPSGGTVRVPHPPTPTLGTYRWNERAGRLAGNRGDNNTDRSRSTDGSSNSLRLELQPQPPQPRLEIIWARETEHALRCRRTRTWTCPGVPFKLCCASLPGDERTSERTCRAVPAPTPAQVESVARAGGGPHSRSHPPARRQSHQHSPDKAFARAHFRSDIPSRSLPLSQTRPI